MLELVGINSNLEQIEKLEKTIKNKEKQKEAIYLDRLEEKISEQLFSRMNQNIETRILELNNEIEQLKNKMDGNLRNKNIFDYNDIILLIKRKNSPGKDCWALPGGFKNNDETFYECAIRELYEETGLQVNNIKGVEYVVQNMFDSPLRNAGGILRNTNCVMFETYINFENDVKLKAADDAAELRWFTVNDIMNHIPIFHDHRDIISELLERYPIYARLNPKYFS